MMLTPSSQRKSQNSSERAWARSRFALTALAEDCRRSCESAARFRRVRAECRAASRSYRKRFLSMTCRVCQGSSQKLNFLSAGKRGRAEPLELISKACPSKPFVLFSDVLARMTSATEKLGSL
jgi:hypothetical protein